MLLSVAECISALTCKEMVGLASASARCREAVEVMLGVLVLP